MVFSKSQNFSKSNFPFDNFTFSTSSIFMYFDIQRTGRTYDLTWGGGNNLVTFMGDVAKWRLREATKDFLSILYNPCTGLVILYLIKNPK